MGRLIVQLLRPPAPRGASGNSAVYQTHQDCVCEERIGVVIISPSRYMRRPRKPKSKSTLSFHQKKLRLAGIILIIIFAIVFALASYWIERRSIVGVP